MKNKLLLLLYMPILVLSSCNNAQKKEYVGIISAMDNEISLLLKEAKNLLNEYLGGSNE